MPGFVRHGGPSDASPRPDDPAAVPHAAVPGVPYLTQDVPGTGGVLKQRPEDFLVDELPLYPPSGQGEHLMMLVEKRGVSTLQMARVLAEHFGVPVEAVGYAGLKDKQAITRQHVTVHVPGRRAEDFPALVHDRIRILWVDAHDRKLRRGHLAGNGFSIRIRQVSPQGVLHAHRTLGILQAKGMPNAVGPQRFGQWGTNHLIGRAMVLGRWQEACDLLLGPVPGARGDPSRQAYAQGDLAGALRALPASAVAERRVLKALLAGKDAKEAVAQMGAVEAGFMVSALQSAVFNAVLEERMRAGTLGVLLEGDVAVVHGARRTTFLVDARQAASPEIADRLARLEISPTGPMWGPSMRRAQGLVAEIEAQALARFGLRIEDLERYARSARGQLTGDRRPLRVPLCYPQVEGGADAHGLYIRCGFELPRGSFATQAMAEVMKPQPAEPRPEAAQQGATGP